MSPKDPSKDKEAKLAKFIRNNAKAIAWCIVSGGLFLTVSVPLVWKWGGPVMRWMRNSDKLDGLEAKLNDVSETQTKNFTDTNQRLSKVEGKVDTVIELLGGKASSDRVAARTVMPDRSN